MKSAARVATRVYDAKKDKRSQKGTVYAIENDRIDVRITPGMSIIRGVKVAGTTDHLSVGDIVLLIWGDGGRPYAVPQAESIVYTNPVTTYITDAVPFTIKPQSPTPVKIYTPIISHPIHAASTNATVSVQDSNPVMEMTQTGYSYIRYGLSLPDGWADKDITVNIWWTPTGTNSGNVRLYAEFRTIQDGTVLQNSYTTRTDYTAASPAVAKQVKLSTFTLSSTGLIEGQAFNLTLGRNGDDGADTLAETAYLVAWELRL